MEMSDLFQVPAVLSPGTHWISDLAGLRARPDLWRREISPTNFRHPVGSLVAMQSLQLYMVI
jgi:hypothetical protein